MTRSNVLVWTALHVPIPTSVDAARAALTALATLSGQPRIVLEASGRENRVRWKLGCHSKDRGRIIRVLTVQLPGIRAEPLTSTLDGLRADTAAAVRVRGSHQAGLNHDEIEPAMRGVLGSLASARHAELVYLQVILGPRRRPTIPRLSSSSDASDRRAVRALASEHRFACQVTVAASTQSTERSRHLIEGVVGALRQLEAPGIRIRLGRANPGTFSQAHAPLLWSGELGVSDLVAFTGWPVAPKNAAPLPGVPSPHPRLLAPTEAVPKEGLRLGVATADSGRSVAIQSRDARQHLWAIGPTGVGKSTLAARVALDHFAAGHGGVVIDPKGDLTDAIMARLDERRLDDVVVLDPRDASPMGVNPLADPRDPDLTADVLLSMFHSLYADAWGPRLHDVLHASLLTLSRRGDASLAMLPLLLTNAGFRRSIVGQASKADPLGLGSFWSWWDGISEAERQQATAPLLRRLRPILMRPGVRAILGQRHPKFDLEDIFTKRRILLVSLAKGVVGPEVANLLGSIVVSQFHMTALGQARKPEASRRPVLLVADELQDFVRLPGDFGDALAQLRSMNVAIVAAHQHLGQLSKSLRESLVTNARSKVAFSLSGGDAREFAGLARGRLEAEDFSSLPAFHAYAQILKDNSPGPWVSLATRPLDEPVRDPLTVRQRSQSLYGQPLDEVEADLLSLAEPSAPADEPLGRVGRVRNRSSEGGAS